MFRMFFSCYDLTTLDVSNWDTSACTNMSGMFGYCNSLSTIKGALDLSHVTNVLGMFTASSELRGVHLKNVPRSLDLSGIGGTEGVTYIVDNYID